ncbi:cytosolic arginine sensor for mTORC1 subunit 2-like [Amphiura filiformis]|uniref:cytosolic arginine sensor for mTORC1 subunit 2-like n=1 Tax=Amphiura filiformis TaxID=82378 RepID=UPI003B20DB67
MELHILSHRLHLMSILKENIDLFTHHLIKLALLQANKSCKFFSFTETTMGYTLIVDEDGIKELPQKEELQKQGSRWVVLSASSGPSEISGLTEITKSVIIPLANNNLSIMSLSTYQTDYILVKEENLHHVVRCLCPHFKVFHDVNGEMVPYKVDTLIEDQADPPIIERLPDGVCRSIVHPLASPQNRFLITSLQIDLLPQVISTLLQIMFYSNSFLPNPQDGHERFFSISIIEDKISLVLDTDALALFPSGILGTGTEEECWKMVKIGAGPLGFEESGIVAQISEPLAEADIHMYYISTFLHDHTLIPEVDIDRALSLLQNRQCIQ